MRIEPDGKVGVETKAGEYGERSKDGEGEFIKVTPDIYRDGNLEEVI